MPEQLFSVATEEDHCRADIQPWRKLQPMQAPSRKGAHTEAGFLAGIAAHGGTTLEQSVPEGLYPLEGNHIIIVLEELRPMERTRGEVHEGMYPVGGTSYCRMATV